MTWPVLPDDALIATADGHTVLVRARSGQVNVVNASAAFVLSHRALFNDIDDAVSEIAAVVGVHTTTVRAQLEQLDRQLAVPSAAPSGRAKYLDEARRRRPVDDPPSKVSQEFTVDALGVCVRVVSHDADVSEVLAPLLAAHSSCDRPGERIDVWKGAGDVRVTLNGRRMSSDVSMSMAAQTVVGLLTAIAIDNGATDLLVHSAAVEVGGAGLILAGPSGAGKSSTTVELVKGGAGYISDELVRIEPLTREVVGFPRAIGLEGPARHHHEDLRPRWWHESAIDSRWTLGPLDVGRVASRAPIRAIVHLELSRVEPPTTRRLAWHEALTYLLPVLYHREELTQTRLDPLIELLVDLPSYLVRHRGSQSAADQVLSVVDENSMTL